LNYELDTYLDALQQFPDYADQLDTAMGTAQLIKKDIFKNLMWYILPNNNKHYPLTIQRVKEIKRLNQAGTRVDDLQAVEVISGKPKEVEPAFADLVGQISLKTLEKNDRRRRDQERGNDRRPDDRRPDNRDNRDSRRPQQQNQGQSGNRNNPNRGPQQQQRPPQENRGPQRPPQENRGPQGGNNQGQPRGTQQNRGPRPQGQGPRPNQPRPNQERPGPDQGAAPKDSTPPEN
jgi:hypothetical protein